MKNKNFYCECCGQENLEEWIELSTGTIVCSEKCKKEWNKLVKEEKEALRGKTK